MARSARRGQGNPALRAAVVARATRLYKSFPSGPKRQAEIAAIEAGAPVVIDTVTLGDALSQLGSPLARQFGYRSDPDNIRQFLLNEDNELTEITPTTSPRRD